MESVFGIVNCIVTKAVEYSIYPIINHVKYLSNHRKNVETLNDHAEKLKDARDRVQHSVDAALRNGEEIERDVNNWLSAVNGKILGQVEKVMQDEGKAKKKCFVRLCPNFWTRYKLSFKAEEEAKTVADLLEQGKFREVSYPVALQDITVPPVKGYEEFESRTLVFNGIMEALKDDSVSVIGVYGMGGIGKTTLAREIASKVKGKLFDSVVIATVTQAIDVEKIQNQIADLLGLKLEEQSMVGKALRLRERLKKEVRILVVLDDIWAKIDIEEVGIPLGDEHKGCKLLLTSRELNILSNEMDAQKCFAIGFLNELEAWDLFKKKAGDCVECCDLKPTAKKVVEKCAGLPIAIATVAGALRNKRLFEWKNALRELERPSSSNFTGITAAYSAIEWSFYYLESEEVKLTFLLCCVIGHNGLVEKLMRYTVGLGLFGGINTIEEARNKVLTVVASLKASSLLLDSYNDERFDIHDVVWDAAVAIASRDYHMLVLRDHVPMEWSDKEKMNSWRRISLTCPQIIAELPKELECSGLSFFHMTHYGSVEIPPDFFRRIESLKVLDLPHGPSFSYLQESIIHLPESINHLIDLHMLCLRGCPVEDVTIIGELKNLEILDLAKSSIKELPKEIAQLTQLRLLDLSWCTELKIIAPNVLSGLSKLEELFMEGSFAEWENEGVVDNDRRNASLDELNSLPRLTTLYAHIPDAQMIPKHRFIETLERYMIFVGDYNVYEWCQKHDCLRTLKLKLYTNIDLDNGVKMLLKKTQDLYLDLEGIQGIENVLEELNNGEDFPYLKRVHVKNGKQVQYITMNKIGFSELRSITLEYLPQLISFCSQDERYSMSSESLPLFNKQFVSRHLESLQLCSINTKRIWHNQTYPQLSNLTSLFINECGNLEHLLSPSLANSLVQLQRFQILDCESLREIIFTEKIEEEKIDVICFPRLNYLRIEGLRNLIFFCSRNYNIEFPLLKELEIEDCPKLKEFICQTGTKSSIQALFSEKVAIPSLERMTISYLSYVKMIFDNELAPGSFCKLEEISVAFCDELLTIFSSKCLIRVFNCLQMLQVWRCESLEQIFEVRGLNTNKIHAADSQPSPKLKIDLQGQEILTFQNLRQVVLEDCWSLKNLFPVSIAKHLPQLEHLRISRCGVEEIVLGGEGVEEQPVRFKFPKVSSLEVTDLEKLKCFYKGQHTIVWPMLKKMKTDSSTLRKIVAPEHLRLIQDTNGNGQPVLFVEEVFPNLEELRVVIFGDMDQFPLDLFHNIKLFRLSCSSHGGSSYIFPFLRRFYNLESLLLSGFDFKDVVHCKGDARTLKRIKNLKLQSSRNLKHIWRKDSVLGYILSNLQTLEVWNCEDLINIGARSLSFQNLTTLHVSFCKMMKNLVAPSVVENLVQLTTMRVKGCTKMTEIVAHEGDYHQTIVAGKLKCLQLSELQSLTSFCPGSYTFNFPCLEEVVVERCPKLKIFSEGALSTPQLQRVKQETFDEKGRWTGDLNTTIQQLYMEKGGFNGPRDLNISDTFPKLIETWKRNPQEILELQNLREMEFYKCSSLKYIFTPSMLLSLKQLDRIEVKECNTMEQVIREEEEATIHKLTFPKLSFVKIEACSNLTNFFLGSRPLEFPKFIDITIVDCPKMTAFSSSVSRESGDASENVVGEGDIDDNTAIFFSDKVVIPLLMDLKLSSVNIHSIWHYPSSSSLRYLYHLRVEGCHNLKYLFPSSLVKHLVQLKILQIWDCNMMEQVIFTDGLGAEDQWRNHTIFSKLDLLSLEDLPKLTSFCFQNYSEFPCLTNLRLKKCPFLKAFMSISVSRDEPRADHHLQASNLVHNSAVLNEKVVFPSLEKLHIQNCDSLQGIIEAQGLIANTSTTQSIVRETTTIKFVFPKLIYLGLNKVPRLKSFCSRMHTTQWPSLKHMEVIECPKAHIFAPKCPKSQVEISNQQPLFCVNEDTFPVLEELTLKTNDMMKGICDGQLSLQCFPNLKLLNLHCFPGTSTTLPYCFIQSLPKLQKLVIFNASISKIVRSEGLSDKERQTSAFYQLKELRLSKLPKLTLKTFQPSLLSFKKLTTLEVISCHGFINLMACSTAESLMLLERLSVADCEMIEEIIACEGEEIQGSIIFPKLKYLKLSGLPSLASFSLAHHSLEFPVLQMVMVTKCPKMRNFCQGDLSTSNLQQMHVTRDEEDELWWEGDLNTTIKQMFNVMNVKNSQVT
ncbi:uncharacterized protein LOC108466970 isoform X1 [Gossypium arboreum]|uniref:uncharacterized protein LOC108466970 isoform X1 n=1 Tax=Gossypium arboreum TaxID=29729 RepID=UPI00081911EB|nr:uncharacterized protein LOC108466970 isoform X1 [Gossypium arboreum]XP_017622866.1 uncharacterized protein LOC108466970 isoform X1 [Gossypium arboreum]XP_017622869.1 uncharacterized protein LOC108466970 isoform X1 [Gossypium arboreum]